MPEPAKKKKGLGSKKKSGTASAAAAATPSAATAPPPSAVRRRPPSGVLSKLVSHMKQRSQARSTKVSEAVRLLEDKVIERFNEDVEHFDAESMLANLITERKAKFKKIDTELSGQHALATSQLIRLVSRHSGDFLNMFKEVDTAHSLLEELKSGVHDVRFVIAEVSKLSIVDEANTLALKPTSSSSTASSSANATGASSGGMTGGGKGVGISNNKASGGGGPTTSGGAGGGLSSKSRIALFYEQEIAQNPYARHLHHRPGLVNAQGNDGLSFTGDEEQFASASSVGGGMDRQTLGAAGGNPKTGRGGSPSAAKAGQATASTALGGSRLSRYSVPLSADKIQLPSLLLPHIMSLMPATSSASATAFANPTSSSPQKWAAGGKSGAAAADTTTSISAQQVEAIRDLKLRRDVMLEELHQLVGSHNFTEALQGLIDLQDDAAAHGLTPLLLSIEDQLVEAVERHLRQLPATVYHLHEVHRPLLHILTKLGRRSLASTVYLDTCTALLKRQLDETTKMVSDPADVGLVATDITCGLVQHALLHFSEYVPDVAAEASLSAAAATKLGGAARRVLSTESAPAGSNSNVASSESVVWVHHCLSLLCSTLLAPQLLSGDEGAANAVRVAAALDTIVRSADRVRDLMDDVGVPNCDYHLLQQLSGPFQALLQSLRRSWERQLFGSAASLGDAATQLSSFTAASSARSPQILVMQQQVSELALRRGRGLCQRLLSLPRTSFGTLLCSLMNPMLSHVFSIAAGASGGYDGALWWTAMLQSNSGNSSSSSANAVMNNNNNSNNNNMDAYDFALHIVLSDAGTMPSSQGALPSKFVQLVGAHGYVWGSTTRQILAHLLKVRSGGNNSSSSSTGSSNLSSLQLSELCERLGRLGDPVSRKDRSAIVAALGFLSSFSNNSLSSPPSYSSVLKVFVPQLLQSSLLARLPPVLRTNTSYNGGSSSNVGSSSAAASPSPTELTQLLQRKDIDVPHWSKSVRLVYAAALRTIMDHLESAFAPIRRTLKSHAATTPMTVAGRDFLTRLFAWHVEPFDAAVLQQSAEKFEEKILLEGLPAAPAAASASAPLKLSYPPVVSIERLQKFLSLHGDELDRATLSRSDRDALAEMIDKRHQGSVSQAVQKSLTALRGPTSQRLTPEERRMVRDVLKSKKLDPSELSISMQKLSQMQSQAITASLLNQQLGIQAVSPFSSSGSSSGGAASTSAPAVSPTTPFMGQGDLSVWSETIRLITADLVEQLLQQWKSLMYSLRSSSSQPSLSERRQVALLISNNNFAFTANFVTAALAETSSSESSATRRTMSYTANGVPNVSSGTTSSSTSSNANSSLWMSTGSQPLLRAEGYSFLRPPMVSLHSPSSFVVGWMEALWSLLASLRGREDGLVVAERGHVQPVVSRGGGGGGGSNAQHAQSLATAPPQYDVETACVGYVLSAAVITEAVDLTLCGAYRASIAALMENHTRMMKSIYQKFQELQTRLKAAAASLNVKRKGNAGNLSVVPQATYANTVSLAIGLHEALLTDLIACSLFAQWVVAQPTLFLGDDTPEGSLQDDTSGGGGGSGAVGSEQTATTAARPQQRYGVKFVQTAETLDIGCALIVEWADQILHAALVLGGGAGSSAAGVALDQVEALEDVLDGLQEIPSACQVVLRSTSSSSLSKPGVTTEQVQAARRQEHQKRQEVIRQRSRTLTELIRALATQKYQSAAALQSTKPLPCRFEPPRAHTVQLSQEAYPTWFVAVVLPQYPKFPIAAPRTFRTNVKQSVCSDITQFVESSVDVLERRRVQREKETQESTESDDESEDEEEDDEEEDVDLADGNVLFHVAVQCTLRLLALFQEQLLSRPSLPLSSSLEELLLAPNLLDSPTADATGGGTAPTTTTTTSNSGAPSSIVAVLHWAASASRASGVPLPTSSSSTTSSTTSESQIQANFVTSILCLQRAVLLLFAEVLCKPHYWLSVFGRDVPPEATTTSVTAMKLGGTFNGPTTTHKRLWSTWFTPMQVQQIVVSLSCLYYMWEPLFASPYATTAPLSASSSSSSFSTKGAQRSGTASSKSPAAAPASTPLSRGAAASPSPRIGSTMINEGWISVTTPSAPAGGTTTASAAGGNAQAPAAGNTTSSSSSNGVSSVLYAAAPSVDHQDGGVSSLARLSGLLLRSGGTARAQDSNNNSGTHEHAYHPLGALLDRFLEDAVVPDAAATKTSSSSSTLRGAWRSDAIKARVGKLFTAVNLVPFAVQDRFAVAGEGEEDDDSDEEEEEDEESDEESEEESEEDEESSDEDAENAQKRQKAKEAAAAKRQQKQQEREKKQKKRLAEKAARAAAKKEAKKSSAAKTAVSVCTMAHLHELLIHYVLPLA